MKFACPKCHYEMTLVRVLTPRQKALAALRSKAYRKRKSLKAKP